MPPRRSCFAGGYNIACPESNGFNATTAFLLPKIAAPMTRGSRVSMPPRRSCFFSILFERSSALSGFNATTAFLLLPERMAWCSAVLGFNATTAFLLRRPAAAAGAAREGFQCHHGVPASKTSISVMASSFGGSFQCHHGVPASGPGWPGPAGRCRVSMPPRRSCFIFSRRARKGDDPCFNATTAFLLRPHRLAKSSCLMSFNATTAFLLPTPAPVPGPADAGFQCHHGVPASVPPIPSGDPETVVSMPPRRSCFRQHRDHGGGGDDRFNATTAFLLRAPDSAPPPGGTPVSMPPRRSCFPVRHHRNSPEARSFNATTAFLLRSLL